MCEWEHTVFCACCNFRKWRSNPVMVVLAVVIFAFSVWNVSWIDEFCFASGMRISPWIAPFLTGHMTMNLAYGVISVLLFSSAPFIDPDTPFVMIRTGKAAWIKGQLLYIFMASLAVPLFYLVSALLVISPCMGWSVEWGTVIQTLANYPSEVTKYGIKISGAIFDAGIINNSSPIASSVIAILLMWMVTAFTGVFILAFNVIVCQGSGTVAAGVMIFISLFEAFAGALFVGPKMKYVSVYNWVNIGYFSEANPGSPISIFYAIGTLGFSIILLSTLSVIVFCRKDMDFKK